MRPRRLAVLLALLLLMASASTAQFRRGGRGFETSVPFATKDSFDGGFQFCRIYFRNASNGDGAGWSVDYPRADQNLSIRLSELTKTPVSMRSEDEPKHLVLRLTDPELFHCPFVMMTEPGGAYFDDNEAAALRTYLEKGGFLWADDFWGDYAWNFWEGQLRKALPSKVYPIADLPLDHPIFHQVMTVRQIPQIPSINFWQGTGRTSERGPESAVPHVRAATDEHGRIMVLMTFNTDFGDAFEREGESHEYFEKFSVPGYAFGINALVYSMTH
jgi:hypothetical protein